MVNDTSFIEPDERVPKIFSKSTKLKISLHDALITKNTSRKKDIVNL